MDDKPEFEAVTARQLPNWSTICISGNDRVAFLQGQLTQDVAKLTANKVALSGWANNKGRLLSICWVCDWRESLWLVLPAERRDAVARRLQMFVLRAAVEISTPDTPVQFIQESNVGSNKKLLNGCFYSDLYFYFRVAEAPLAGLALGNWPASDHAEDNTKGNSHDADADAAWRRTLIEAGIPAIYDDTAESFVPQMVNLDLTGGISFDKGCYVGQEIVARTHNLGRIKRRMFGFTCTATNPPAAPGSEIYAGQDLAGSVVDGVITANGQQLLGVIKLDKRATELRLGTPDGPVLNFHDLPYEIPEIT